MDGGTQWNLAEYTALAVIMLGLLSGGCAGTRSVVFEFSEPRTFLHAHGNPEKIGEELETDGPQITFRRDLINANADFVILGVGTIRWQAWSIRIQPDGIEMDGVFVESLPQGYRNATIGKDGSIQTDAFIPFEPWWGHHRTR